MPRGSTASGNATSPMASPLADHSACSGAKRRAEADAGIGPGTVDRRHVLGRHARLHAMHVQTTARGRRPGIQYRCAASVQSPPVFRLAAAENLNLSPAAVFGSAKHCLHAPPVRVPRPFFRKDHRTVHL